MTQTHPYARGSTRRRWATTAGIGLIGGPLLAGWMLLPVASAVPADKVQICHATGSVSNPYIVTQVDISSVDEEGNQFLNGHGDHTGPIFDPDNPPESWGDIIPPITNPDTGTTFPGLNWPAGEAIWENGCQVPTMSPSPTETSPTPTQTSPTPTETSPSPTETSPSPTETTVSPSPGSTVTVTATVTATQVIVVPGPGVTTTVTATPTPTPTETTVSPSPGTTSPTPTQTSPTPTQTTVSPSPGTTSPTPTTGTPTTTTLSPSPGVTVTGTGLPTGVAAGGGPMPPIPGLSDPLRPPVLWAASAALTAMGLLALARVRRLN